MASLNCWRASRSSCRLSRSVRGGMSQSRPWADRYRLPGRPGQVAGRLKRGLDVALVEVAGRAFIYGVEIDPQLVGMRGPERAGQPIADERTPQPSRDGRTIRSPIGNEYIVIELRHLCRHVAGNSCRPRIAHGLNTSRLKCPASTFSLATASPTFCKLPNASIESSFWTLAGSTSPQPIAARPSGVSSAL
jgi:hypothetical protein